ncbi:uncharacterized protein Z519_04024 [Cladophialophora bantiana CBS 173.52]|uniref:Major facilitator superfamily (MFS) profile domain-containing protein n=1 Tax=Cladophialophora bantiana (strain ATCC 10958 / CBS 173.52 / CDC B-1940 / NIH 8579) TaxID=1442370 RepID=A0A0D2HWZ5_CLAB1|nr:uncharacterized protein Z519_04024 [Cladophialophora bantiana CBS 173.52]KIW95440.1 hypothetical protein Z519_04024 [Cladophialophora bantiana CBS 173.52]
MVEKATIELREDLAETIDTFHNDEALKVIVEEHGQNEWDAAEEKRLVRKIDWKLLPLLCLTYGLQYYDKAMLSQAAIFGLRDDLDLSVGNRYTFSSAILYMGFLTGSYPATVLAQKYPIERVAGGLVFTWGVCLMSTAGCTSFRGLYAQRFFLGCLEAGISPIFMLVVGGWYEKGEQALRMGAWFCCTGYFGAVSPLVNYGLGQISGGTLSSWQYMYLVAGGITILWALVILTFLPADPIRARGFSSRERYIAVARLRKNNSGVRNLHWKSPQLIESLTDAKFWLSFFMAFFMMFGNGPYSTFTPIIVHGFGFSALNSLLLTVPAGVFVGSVELGACYMAFKFKNSRTIIMFLCQLPTVAASLLLWLLPRHELGGSLLAVFIIASFGGTYAVLLGLTIANCAGYTKKTTFSAGLFVGYCLGNIAGPLIFREKDAPRYATGFIIVLITAILTQVLTIIYRYLCILENKKRDKSGILEGFDHAYEDDLTDKTNPQFRYTY